MNILPPAAIRFDDARYVVREIYHLGEGRFRVEYVYDSGATRESGEFLIDGETVSAKVGATTAHIVRFKI